MTQINYIDRMSAINRPEQARPVAIAPERTPVGQSVPAIIIACILALFTLPIAFLLGIMSLVVFYPDIGLDQDGMTVGWGFYGFVHGALVVIIAGMVLNRFRNYATNIVGIAFIVGYVLAYVILTTAYRIGGPEAFM